MHGELRPEGDLKSTTFAQLCNCAVIAKEHLASFTEQVKSAKSLAGSPKKGGGGASATEKVAASRRTVPEKLKKITKLRQAVTAVTEEKSLMSKIVLQQQLYARVHEKNFPAQKGKAPHVIKRATMWRNSKKAMSLEYRSAAIGGIKLKANLVISSLSSIDTLNQSFDATIMLRVVTLNMHEPGTGTEDLLNGRDEALTIEEWEPRIRISNLIKLESTFVPKREVDYDTYVPLRCPCSRVGGMH